MQQQIYRDTFKGCKSLKQLTFPTSVLSIGDCACQGCSSLVDVQLGSSLKFIGTSAFCGDVSLSSVSRFNGGNVKDGTGSPFTFDIVGNYAFAGTGLVSANLALRSSAIQTFWGDGCFQDCKSLRYVHFLEANYMSRNMFKGCTSLVSADYDVPMMAYTYPSIFDGCSKLQKISLPAQLLFVPEGIFRGCSGLLQATFNTYGSDSGIDEVQKDAYYGTESLTQLEFPQSIDSLDKLDPECFRGANRLNTVKFHGIGADQLSTQVSHGLPAAYLNVHLNEWNEFEDPYYALFSTYSEYESSGIDDGTTTISEGQYNVAVRDVADNYDTIQSIIQVGTELSIPVLVAIGISYINASVGFHTPQDFITDYSATSPFWGDNHAELGIIYPSNKLSVKIGTKQFNCQYLYDADLINAFIYGNGSSWNDSAYQAEMKKHGYTDQEIRKYTSCIAAGEAKQQLSAIFVMYKLDLGDIYFDFDWEGDIDARGKQYIPKLKSAIKDRLSKLTGKLTGTLRNSGFKSINQSFFNTNSGVHSTLKSYDNYGIICTKFNTTKNTRTKVVFPNGISSDMAISEFSDDEYTKLNDAYYAYLDKHPADEISYFYYSPGTMNDTEIASMLNGICVQELKKFIGKNGYKAVNLDRDCLLPDGKRVSDIAIIRKANMVDAVEKSGFFGLKHDVKVWCRGMPSGQYLQYVYSEDYYEPPTRVDYKSDKSAVANFKTGVWYYNAKDVYAEARRTGTPCLFIYSLWGCGPCAVYQKKLWNSKDFQDWFKKQKFLLCGLECEQQPMYDQHLQFLVDSVSVNAKNFAKEDADESYASTPVNALGAKFKRYAAGGSTATTLMTPVLVFMDKSGNCWDYSYHNIVQDIGCYGVSGMLQRLKSLCLYHFDGNTLKNAKYVVDAGKAFNAADYAKSVDNPWQVAPYVMNMSMNVSIPEEEYVYEKAMTPLQLEQSMSPLLRQVAPAIPAGKAYVAGCLFKQLKWVGRMFYDSEIDPEKLAMAEELNSAFEPWYFKIGDGYYRMTFDGSDKIRIINPCGGGKGDEEDIYRVVFQPVKAP